MILDLYAGPGGWDVGAHWLGLETLGVEWDAAACATRSAAGFATVRADVAQVATAPFVGKLDGLIASPPCPSFSAAGGRSGIAELPFLIAHVHACADGTWRPYEPPETLGYVMRQNDDRRWREAVHPDPRSELVLEPLRFVLDCEPEWVAMEQVPPVLPVWEAYERVLRGLGYSAWCGILNAADFGVPQTRQRAIFMAHRSRPVSPPEPTHCQGGAVSLFGELAPWVSMAQALGWGMTARPGYVMTGSADGGRSDGLGGSGARRGVHAAQRSGAWVDGVDPATVRVPAIGGSGESSRTMDEPSTTLSFGHAWPGWRVEPPTDGWPDGVNPADVQVGFPRLDDTGTSSDEYRERDWRSGDEPAFALTEKARSWVLRASNDRPNAAVRELDEPAPTVAFGHAGPEWVEVDPDDLVVRTANFTAVRRNAAGERDAAGSVPYERPVSEPAPTLDTRAQSWSVQEGSGLEAADRLVASEQGLVVATGNNSATLGPDQRDGVPWRDRSKPYERPVSEPAPTVDAKAGGAWSVGPPGHREVVRTNHFTGERDEDGNRVLYERTVDEPAPALASRGDLWEVGEPKGDGVSLHTNRDVRDGVPHQVRPASEPAPSLSGGGKQLVQWEFRSDPPAEEMVVNTGRDWKEGGTREDAQRVPLTDPAPAIDGKGRWRLEHLSDGDWPQERPATTLAGDARVFAPGGHIANDGRDNSRMVGRSENAIRLAIGDALVLQSFPADYPVSGSKSKQFEQVGNAVPPRLAAHVLAAVVGIELTP